MILANYCFQILLHFAAALNLVAYHYYNYQVLLTIVAINHELEVTPLNPTKDVTYA